MEDHVLIKDVMIHKVIVGSPSVSAKHLAAQMNENNIGCVIIVDEKQAVVGIVTEKDLVHKVLARDKDSSEVKAQEIMTTPVSTVSPSSDVLEAAHLMGKINVRRLPVVEKGRLVGVVTDRDIINTESNLVDILKEFIVVKGGSPDKTEKPKRGICEVCDNFATDIIEIGGVPTCGGCREEEMS